MDWEAFIRPHVHPMVPYAPGLRGSEVREIAGGGDVLKLSSNESSYGPFPRALEAGARVLRYLNRYPDGSARDLRARLSERLAVPPSQIVIGNGSNELIVRLAQATVTSGDEVVFAWPSFVVYRIACQLTGATAVEVPLDSDDRHDLNALLAAITPATKIVFLCNPNNPTGTMYPSAEFDRFMERVPDHVLVVVDEAYFEFGTDATYASALSHYDGERPLVVLRTFSKAYSLAGARVGYGIMPVALVGALDKIREPFNVGVVAQAMAYYSLDDEAELDRRILEVAEQRERLTEALRHHGVACADSQTNFVWAHLTQAPAVFDALIREGIIVRAFGAAPALRFGVGTPDETDRLIDALNHIADLGLLS